MGKTYKQRDMTIGEIEQRARQLLGDDNERKSRFTEEDLFRAIKDAAIAVRTLRPESRYRRGRLVDLTLLSSDGAAIPFSVPAAPDAAAIADFRARALEMDDQWCEAIVYHVVHAMHLSELTASSRTYLAQHFQSKFLQCLNS